MGRFTPQIRADLLQFYGVDLSEWLEQGRWNATLELIDQLPWNSRFREAMLNDPEYAAAIAENQVREESEGKLPDDSPRVSEYGPSDQRLDTLIELNKALLMWTQKQAGVKSPKRIPPGKGPKTLVQELKTRKEQEFGFEVAKLFGFSEDDFFLS